MGLFSRKPKGLSDQDKFLNFVIQGLEAWKHTPDQLQLVRKHDHFVFIVDELMSRHPSHDKIAGPGVYKVFPQALSVDKLTLWQHDADKWSTAIPISRPIEGVPMARVRGEVYLLEPDAVFKLDKIKRNLVEFIRIPVKVQIPHRYASKIADNDPTLYHWAVENSPRFWELPAFMYMGVPDFWVPLITEGKKMHHIHKNGMEQFSRYNTDKGYVFNTSALIQPNNSKYEKYFHFRPNDNRSTRPDNS